MRAVSIEGKYYTSVSKAVDTIHTRRTTQLGAAVVGEAKKFFHTQELVSLVEKTREFCPLESFIHRTFHTTFQFHV